MSPFRIFNRHPHAELSAYADGQISWEKGRRVERHIDSCEACRAEMADLRSLRSALSDLPELAEPRSFALTPGMVAEPGPAAQPMGLSPAFAGMRIAGAGIAAVLALVVLIDTGSLSTDVSDSGGDDSGAEIASDSNTSDRSFAGSEKDNDSALEPLAAPTPAPDAGDGADIGGGAGDGEGATLQGGASAPLPEGDLDAGEIEGGDEFQDAADAGELPVQGWTGRDDSIATGDEGGISTLLAIEIALGVVAVAAIGGSILIPRITRND